MVDMTERAGGKLDGIPDSIVTMPGMHILYGFFLQSSHKDNKPAVIADSTNPTLGESRAIHDHAYKEYLAVSMIISLDHLIYRKRIENLYNSYYMYIDHCLQTRANIDDTIVHWRNWADRYSLRASPGAVIFAYESDVDLYKNETHANDG